MKTDKNQGNQAAQNNRSGNLDKTTDASGLHLQNPPKGAEQMDESLDKPAANNHQRGDSSRYANTSDNEETQSGR